MNRRKIRLESLLRREIGQYLIKDLQNPNIGFVSIVHVDLSRDYTNARVHVSIFGSEKERSKSFRALKKSAPYIQYLLGKNLSLRVTPIIRFVLTDSLRDGDMMVEKLSALDTDDGIDHGKDHEFG